MKMKISSQESSINSEETFHDGKNAQKRNNEKYLYYVKYEKQRFLYTKDNFIRCFPNHLLLFQIQERELNNRYVYFLFMKQ